MLLKVGYTSDLVESGTKVTGPGETPFAVGLWKSSKHRLPFFDTSGLVAAPFVLKNREFIMNAIKHKRNHSHTNKMQYMDLI